MALRKKTTEYLIVALLLIASSALILSNLGNIYLWQDEAETALLAKSVLSHGLPIAYDGKNYISQTFGLDNGKNFIHRWHPWFPYYLLAGFLAVFGTSTFVARLPFALLGIGTIILTYSYGKALWSSRRAGILASVLLLTCVPFLLLVRQCRYYAPAAFFSLAGLYAYSELLEGRKRASIAFVLAAILLFHTHYVYYAALLAAVITHTLLLKRDRLKLVLSLSAITVMANLPLIIWFSSMGDFMAGYGKLADKTLASFGYYVLQIGKHIFHPALLALPVILYAIGRIRPDRKTKWENGTGDKLLLFALFSVITVIGISVTNQISFFRYLVLLIPIACLITALMLEKGMKVHPAIGVIVILLLAWWWRMPDYLYEITHDYDGPVEGVVQYLNNNASPGDVVAVTHEDLPIKWYTNLRVISGVSGEDFKPALNADWLVLRQTAFYSDYPFIDFLTKSIPWDSYEQIELPFPDIAFENNVDPTEHHFRTVEDADNPVVICRRIAD